MKGFVVGPAAGVIIASKLSLLDEVIGSCK